MSLTVICNIRGLHKAPRSFSYLLIELVDVRGNDTGTNPSPPPPQLAELPVEAGSYGVTEIDMVNGTTVPNGGKWQALNVTRFNHAPGDTEVNRVALVQLQCIFPPVERLSTGDASEEAGAKDMAKQAGAQGTAKYAASVRVRVKVGAVSVEAYVELYP